MEKLKKATDDEISKLKAEVKALTDQAEKERERRRGELKRKRAQVTQEIDNELAILDVKHARAIEPPPVNSVPKMEPKPGPSGVPIFGFKSEVNSDRSSA